MIKKYLVLITIIFYSEPTVTQWVLDYQFNNPSVKYIVDISITDSNYLWLMTQDTLQNTKIFKKINSDITELNYAGIYRPKNIQAIDTSRCYLNTFRGKIYYTSNSGSNWIIRLDSSSISYAWFAASSSDPNFIIASQVQFDTTNNKFYKSTNGGINWLVQNFVLPEFNWVNEISFTDQQHICISIDCQASVCNQLSYLYSSNGGSNWQTINLIQPGINTTITAPVFNVINQVGFTLTPGYENYRFRTTNGGVNWSNPVFISNYLEGGTIIKNIDSSQIWFFARVKKIQKTTNDGLNWFDMTIPLNSTETIICFDVIKKGNKYYAYCGTSAGRIFKLVEDIVPFGIKQISTEVPRSFLLYQNYPNPFNPATKIKFALPKSSFTTLVIYDVLGRELEIIVNEQLNAGTYEADWNADKYSSGVYYYTLKAGDYVNTKKMILLK